MKDKIINWIALNIPFPDVVMSVVTGVPLVIFLEYLLDKFNLW